MLLSKYTACLVMMPTVYKPVYPRGESLTEFFFETCVCSVKSISGSEGLVVKRRVDVQNTSKDMFRSVLKILWFETERLHT